VDAGDGGAQVIVGALRLPDEIIEIGGSESAPPIGTGPLGSAAVGGRDPGGRGREVGAVVVRSERAGRQRAHARAEQQQQAGAPRAATSAQHPPAQHSRDALSDLHRGHVSAREVLLRWANN
jgi:hypothetical protein